MQTQKASWNGKQKWPFVDKLEDPVFEVIMRNFIAIYALVGSSMFSLAQTVTEPHGEGSVVFGSPGGKWQKVVITDQLTGESSTAYSLDAETSAIDTENKRHPRIAFSCHKSGEFDRRSDSHGNRHCKPVCQYF